MIFGCCLLAKRIMCQKNHGEKSGSGGLQVEEDRFFYGRNSTAILRAIKSICCALLCPSTTISWCTHGVDLVEK